MGRPRTMAAKRSLAPLVTSSADEAPVGAGRERMVHIRVSPELHRKLRLIVAAQDTSLQDWVAQTLEDAVSRAWPDISGKATP